jgi:hypothetical protein
MCDNICILWIISKPSCTNGNSITGCIGYSLIFWINFGRNLTMAWLWIESITHLWPRAYIILCWSTNRLIQTNLHSCKKRVSTSLSSVLTKTRVIVKYRHFIVAWKIGYYITRWRNHKTSWKIYSNKNRMHDDRIYFNSSNKWIPY